MDKRSSSAKAKTLEDKLRQTELGANFVLQMKARPLLIRAVFLPTKVGQVVPIEKEVPELEPKKLALEDKKLELEEMLALEDADPKLESEA